MPSEKSSIAVAISLPEAFAVACKASSPIVVRAKHRTTGVEQTFTAQPPFVFIGRSPAAGICLVDPSVSQCHAYLQIVEGAVYCIDIGSRTGVIWDDGSRSRGWVRPNQTLRMGAFDVWVDAGSGQSPASTARAGDDGFAETLLSRASIEIHSETASINGSHSLDRPISLVGRHPSCELRVLDKELAYFQCALVNTSDGVWFVDTMSRHGAVLNGRNSRFARLREGDLLEFGKVSIVFRSGVHPRDARVAVREVRDVPTPNDLVAAISGKVAEAVEGALIPVGEMLNQFQQCFATMTQMFATMQQQNAMVMSEQIRQIQELAVELRDIRASAQKEKSAQVAGAPIPSAPASETVPAATLSNAGSPPATPSRTPVPSFNRDIGDAQTLSEAHSWFLSRLQKQSEPPASGS